MPTNEENFSLDEMFDMNGDDDDDDGDDFGGDREDYPESPYDRFYGVDIALFITFKQMQKLVNIKRVSIFNTTTPYWQQCLNHYILQHRPMSCIML